MPGCKLGHRPSACAAREGRPGGSPIGCRAHNRVRCTKEHRGRPVARVVGAVREPPLQRVEPEPVVELPGSAAGCPDGITPPHGRPTGSPIRCAGRTAAGLADAAPKCTAVSGRRTASPLHCRWGAGSCEPRAFSFVWYRGTAPPCPYVPPRAAARVVPAAPEAVREPPLQCPAMLRRNPWWDCLAARPVARVELPPMGDPPGRPFGAPRALRPGWLMRRRSARRCQGDAPRRPYVPVGAGSCQPRTFPYGSRPRAPGPTNNSPLHTSTTPAFAFPGFLHSNPRGKRTGSRRPPAATPCHPSDSLPVI